MSQQAGGTLDPVGGTGSWVRTNAACVPEGPARRRTEAERWVPRGREGTRPLSMCWIGANVRDKD